jgi:hypothetical protein
MPQEDIEDFISLVKSSSSMNILGVNTSKVSFFGHSSGGHILNLIGSIKDIGLISTLAPVSDLSPLKNTQLLQPWISYYNNAHNYGNWNLARSPTDAWTNLRTTNFYIQHGYEDIVVPPQQSIDFKSKVGNLVKLCLFPKAGHFFLESYSNPNDLNPTYKSATYQTFQFFSGVQTDCTPPTT